MEEFGKLQQELMEVKQGVSVGAGYTSQDSDSSPNLDTVRCIRSPLCHTMPELRTCITGCTAVYPLVRTETARMGALVLCPTAVPLVRTDGVA